MAAVPKAKSKRKTGTAKPYTIRGKRYYPKSSSEGHRERGLASWYGKRFHGRKTSNGERYNMYAMTAAHKTLPLPSYVKVTNVKNGRSAVVRVNDRGPFHGRRVIDLSYAAARKLGVVKHGTAMVEVRAIDPRTRDGDSENLFVQAKPSQSRKGSKQPARLVAKKAPSKKAPRVAAVSSKPKSTPKAKSAPKQQPKPVVAAQTKVAAVDAGQGSKTRSSTASQVYLQVGAFGDRTNAEQLRRRLVDQLEERVMVRTADGSKVPLYKVHVGPLDSKGKADDVSDKLATLGLPETMVVRE